MRQENFPFTHEEITSRLSMDAQRVQSLTDSELKVALQQIHDEIAERRTNIQTLTQLHVLCVNAITARRKRKNWRRLTDHMLKTNPHKHSLHKAKHIHQFLVQDWQDELIARPFIETLHKRLFPQMHEHVSNNVPLNALLETPHVVTTMLGDATICEISLLLPRQDNIVEVEYPWKAKAFITLPFVVESTLQNSVEEATSSLPPPPQVEQCKDEKTEVLGEAWTKYKVVTEIQEEIPAVPVASSTCQIQ